MPHMEAEEAIEKLEQMFKDYYLDEYLPAFNVWKSEWERVCKDNREFRTGMKRDGKGTAA